MNKDVKKLGKLEKLKINITLIDQTLMIKAEAKKEKKKFFRLKKIFQDDPTKRKKIISRNKESDYKCKRKPPKIEELQSFLRNIWSYKKYNQKKKKKKSNVD